MLIPLLGIAVIIGTVVIAAYSPLPWLSFWEHIGETSRDTEDKHQ